MSTMNLQAEIDRSFHEREQAAAQVKTRYPSADLVGAGASRNGWDLEIDLHDDAGRTLIVAVDYSSGKAWILAAESGVDGGGRNVPLADLHDELGQI